MCALYRYFKYTSSTVIPDPEGPLSKIIPSSTIEAVNKSAEEVVNVYVESGSVITVATTDDDYKAGKKQGHYNHYSAKDKGTIDNHAIQYGTSVAIKLFKPQYPSLKWSTVNNWRRSLIAKTTQNHQ